MPGDKRSRARDDSTPGRRRPHLTHALGGVRARRERLDPGDAPGAAGRRDVRPLAAAGTRDVARALREYLLALDPANVSWPLLRRRRAGLDDRLTADSVGGGLRRPPSRPRTGAVWAPVPRPR
jgi:hypothetical protein